MANLNPNPAPVPVAQPTAYTQAQQSQWHYIPISQPEATLATGIGTAIVIIIGWIVIHRTTLTREREARTEAARIAREDRLRAFECFLVEREQLTEITPADQISNAYYSPDGLLSSRAFRKEAAAVRRDIDPKIRDEFNRLDESVSRLPPNLLAGDATGTSREKLASAIRKLNDFIKRA